MNIPNINFKILGIMGVLALALGTGTFSAMDGSKYTDAQINATPNEEVTVEKTGSVSSTIGTYTFNDDYSSETIEVWIPENSIIKSVKHTGQATAFGSTNTAEASVESDGLYVFTSSSDVGNSGDSSTDSDVYLNRDNRYIEDEESIQLTVESAASYRNSNNFAEAEGTIEVTYKHLEMLEAFKIDREDGEPYCTTFEYRSDKEPSAETEVFENMTECETAVEEIKDNDLGSIFDPPEDNQNSEGDDENTSPDAGSSALLDAILQLIIFWR